MKKVSLLLLQLLFITAAFGQNTEYSLHLNSGLFSFGGESAAESSFIILSDVASEGSYTNHPYGANKALSYGLAAQVQRVTGGQTIFGLQMGYEVLRSDVHITRVVTDMPGPFEAEGNTILKHKYINVYPYLGYRFPFEKFEVDIMVGSDIGLPLSSSENGTATMSNGNFVETDTDRQDPGTDLRLRSSVAAYYKNWGVSIGYSYGLSNYTSGMDGGVNENFSRFIRFGISYKLK